MKTCILITSEYPFKNAETFLEDEISILSSSFDTVFIFAISSGCGEKITREIPPNVKPFGITSTGRIMGLLKGSTFRRKEFKHDSLKVMPIIVDQYFKGKASIAYGEIKKVVEKYDFDEMDSVAIYSYWFVTHAMVAIMLKSYFNEQHVTCHAFSRAHGYDLYKERNRASHLPYRKSLLSHLDGVFPCSKNGCDYLLHNFPDAKNKIHLARLGTSDYGTNSIKQASYCTIVTCSSLIPLKRISLFAEAFSALASKYDNIYWVCIGDGPEYQEIYEIVKNNNILDKVDFKGRLSHDEVIEFYKKNYVDLFCNVSEYEGVPVSIMEAQSFSIPVLATNVGGTGEIVNTSNGFLVDKDISVEELARSMEMYINILEKQSDNIRKVVREFWEKNSDSNREYKKWVETLSTFEA